MLQFSPRRSSAPLVSDSAMSMLLSAHCPGRALCLSISDPSCVTNLRVQTLALCSQVGVLTPAPLRHVPSESQFLPPFLVQVRVNISFKMPEICGRSLYVQRKPLREGRQDHISWPALSHSISDFCLPASVEDALRPVEHSGEVTKEDGGHGGGG